MTLELNDTNASQISAALIAERRKAGSPLMGMVMTFVVVADESESYDAVRYARTVSREHPARILAVIRRGSGRGRPNLDAELTIGGSGESVLLRMSGELTAHADSVVLPLLLPDSPVVVWWPGKGPDDPAADSLGSLAQRRITDSSTLERGRGQAILTQARHYQDGNTDMAWTRLTPWRALLAAALDQYPAAIQSAVVEAERSNPSADLLVAWLTDRLRVEVTRTISKGPGITAVTMQTGGGEISITRPDGLLAQFTIPNSPDRPVALKRRDIPELLAEELRRLDPDDIYASAVQTLCELADGTTARGRSGSLAPVSRKAAARTSTTATGRRGRAVSAKAMSSATPPSDTPAASGEAARTSVGRRQSAATKAAAGRTTGKTAGKTAGKTTTETAGTATGTKASPSKRTTSKRTTSKRTTAKRTAAKKQTTTRAAATGSARS